MKTEKESKKFGIILGIALFVLGTIQLVKGRINVCFSFYGIALAVLFLGIFVPAAIKPIYFIFNKIGYFISNIVTGIILFIVFYFVLTPIALVAKLFGKNFLDIDWNKKSGTYWVKKEQTGEGVQRYEKQF